MRKPSLAILLIFSAFCLKGMADTVTLKDGTKIEGKITQESDSQITVTIQVTPTISDERIVKKEEIKSIEKTSAEEIAFQQLRNLKPDPLAALSESAYDETMGTLKSFLDQYPASAHKADVQAIMDAFEEDHKHLTAGEIKLYGLWIPKQEAGRRASQIQGQTLLLKMKATLAQGDAIGALTIFEQLDKGYSDTRAYPLAVAIALPIINQLQVQVPRSLADLKVETDKWQKGMEITPEPARSQAMAARKAEQDRYDALVAGAGKSAGMWPPFIPQSETALNALNETIAKERPRLLALPVDRMSQSIATTDKASAMIAANDIPGASALLRDAVQMWPKNEETIYLQKWIADTKAASENPDKSVEVAKVAMRPTPKPVAATPKPPPPVAATPAATPEPEEKQSLTDFFFTIPGAATIVGGAIALLAVVSVIQKMRGSRQQDAEEEAEEEQGKP